VLGERRDGAGTSCFLFSFFSPGREFLASRGGCHQNLSKGDGSPAEREWGKALLIEVSFFFSSPFFPPCFGFFFFFFFFFCCVFFLGGASRAMVLVVVWKVGGSLCGGRSSSFCLFPPPLPPFFAFVVNGDVEERRTRIGLVSRDGELPDAVRAFFPFFSFLPFPSFLQRSMQAFSAGSRPVRHRDIPGSGFFWFRHVEVPKDGDGSVDSTPPLPPFPPCFFSLPPPGCRPEQDFS